MGYGQVPALLCGAFFERRGSCENEAPCVVSLPRNAQQAWNGQEESFPGSYLSSTHSLLGKWLCLTLT